MLRQTCAWAYATVHSALNARLLIAGWVRATHRKLAKEAEKRHSSKVKKKEVKKPAVESESETETETGSVSEGTPSDTEGYEDDDVILEQLLQAGTKDVKEMRSLLARSLIRRSLRNEAKSLNPNEVELFETVLDPMVPDSRIKAFSSIRYFPIPRAFYFFRASSTGSSTAGGSPSQGHLD